MSNPYEKHPGKGFEYIHGYEPPAGTLASEDKKRKEAAERRKKEETEERWRAQSKELLRRQEEAEKRRKAQWALERRNENAKKKGYKPATNQKKNSSWGGIILIAIILVIAGKKETTENNTNQKSGKTGVGNTRSLDRAHKAKTSMATEGKPFQNGILLYQDYIENYRDDWWGRKLTTQQGGGHSNEVVLTIQGEGKTVDFIGNLTINCTKGTYSWSGMKNFRSTVRENEARSIVPKKVIENAIKFFCTGR